MSKKDELDMDLDDFGADDFDEPPRSSDRSRNPVLETASVARKSALKALWGRGQRTKVILDAMPDVAEGVHDGYLKNADVVSTLLSHTKDEVVKTERVLKQQTRQLMPTLRKYLPESLTKRVGNWAKNDDYDYGNYDPVQAAIDRMMGETFGQAGSSRPSESEDRVERESRRKEAAETAAKDKIRQTVDRLRMDELLRTTAAISRDVRSHTDLASGVMIQVQKRSLELQYRSLFALQDLIKVQQTSLDRFAPALEGILKNTGLPDYAKEEFSEITHAQLKRKVASWINPARYAEGFFDQLKERGGKKIAQLGSEIRSGLSGIMENAVEDDFDLDDDTGLSPDSQKKNLAMKGVDIGTGWLVKKLLGPTIEKLQKKGKDYLSDKPGVMRALNKGAYTFNNMSSISNSALAGERDGFLGDTFGALRALGIVDPYRREQVGLDQRNGESLTKASKFDQKTYLTINEVIPAWFGRLNRSILSLSGREVDETYDITTRGFIDNKKLANRVRAGVANDRSRIRLQNSVNETVSFLDKDKKLSDVERTRLGSFIEQRASLGREFNVAHLLKDPQLLQQAMGFKGSEKVVEMLRGHANAGKGGTYQLTNELARRMGDIQSHITERQTNVNEAAAIYGEKLLRDAGIFHYNAKDDSFGADTDFSDPYTLFNSLEVGKTRTGRARDKQQEIARKLANGSASGHWLRNRYQMDGSEISNPSPELEEPQGGFLNFLRGDNRRRGGGRPIKGGGMSRQDLSTVLYGAQKTNLVELLQPLREFTQVANPTGTRSLEEAIRGNNHGTVLSEILAHVKSIDEKGIRFANGEEVAGSAEPGEGGKKKKAKGITAKSLFGQWFQLMGNTASGAWGLAGKGFGKLNEKRKALTGWLRGKFTGGEGPGLLSRAGTFAGGLWSGATTFVKSTIGWRDIYGADGKVVLSAKKLQAGEYYQYKGVKLIPLTKLEDINYKASILDAAGREVVSAEELQKHGALTYYKGGRWHSLLQAIGGKAGETIHGVAGKMNTARKWLGAQGSEKLGMIKNWFVDYPDIYVKGDNKPRIKSRLLKAGHYFVKGKAIYSPDEIVDVVTDANGNEIISEEEITNPKFELVDGWGREVRTPLGRMGNRIRRVGRFAMEIPKKAWELGGKAMKRIAEYAGDNPLTRWWKGDRSKSKGGGWFNFNFGSKARKSTDHILIRIYKLLNGRMAGESEDETWTNEFEKNTGGGAAGIAARKRARRMARRMKAKWQARWDKSYEKGAGWFNRGKERASAGWGWLTRKGRVVGRNANEMVDPYRSAGVDIGTRYEALKSLHGRTDDVADFYRSRINRRGGISKAKVYTAAEDAAREGVQAVKGKAKSGWQVLSEKMGNLVNLQEMSWFNTMRSSSEEAGANEGFIRGLYSKWAKRNPLKGDSEKRDYFQFFRRGPKKDKGAKGRGFFGSMKDAFTHGGEIGGLLGLLSTTASVLGALVSPLLSVLKFAGKWGIVKPVSWLVRGGLAAAGGTLGTVAGMAATAGTALVAAVGWPVILGVAAVAALGYTGYKMSQRKPAMFLDKMRLAQYGFRDYDLWSSDDGAKALYLEDNLKGYVSFDEADNATLRSLSAKDVDGLTEGFGIDKENHTEVMSFHAFMIQRFIPVYLYWQTALRQMENDIALGETGRADKVSRDDMLKIFNKVKLSKDSKILQAVSDPRKADQGFFSRVWDTVTFTSPDLLSADEVMDVQSEVEKEIKARKDVRGRSKDSVYFKTHSLEDPASEQRGVAESMKMLAGIDAERFANEIPDGDTHVSDSITVQVDVDKTPVKGDLDALQSLRMKAYGLLTLNQAQVRALLDLEKAVLPKLNLKTSTFEGNWVEAMESLVPGCTASEAGRFKARKWFEGRFLPVFMTFVMGVKRYVPTGDPLNLSMTGGYLYEVALLISKAYSYRADFRQPIWEVNINPFGGPANDDARTINPELETLKLLSKEADMAVRNLLKENQDKTKKRAQWRDVEKAKDEAYKEDRSGLKAVEDLTGGYTGVPAGYEGNGDGSDMISAAGGFGNYVNNTMGLSTITLGEMGEGDYRSLSKKYPLEKLNDPKVAQQLVADAARIAGVPEGVAMAMAFAESKFDYRARPKRRDGTLLSSAAGLFQFLDSTWRGVPRKGTKGELQRYGNRFGIPNGATQMDPYASALLGANFIRNNIKQAERDYGGKVPQGVAYLYHFMGAGNAARFMKALKANPNQLATSIPFKNADGVFSANKSVFFDNGRPRTLAGVMGELSRRMGGSTSAVASMPGMSKAAFKGLNSSEAVDLSLTPSASTPGPASMAANDASIAANDPGAQGAAGPIQDTPKPAPSSTQAPSGANAPVTSMPNTPVFTSRIPDVAPAANQPNSPTSRAAQGSNELGTLVTQGDSTNSLLAEIRDQLVKLNQSAGRGQTSQAAAPAPNRMAPQTFTQPTPTLRVGRPG